MTRGTQMQILEFGDKTKRKIILIHGFQSPYSVWNEYIEHYKTDFHVIVPILPGHDPNRREEFVSFSESAKELEDYVISWYGESVYAVFGMSMGGVMAAKLWQNGRLKFKTVIFDGSPLVSFNTLVRKFMLGFYLNITRKTRERDKSTLKQAVKSIIPNEKLGDFLSVIDNMSDKTVENCINDIASFKLSGGINVENTQIYFFHGTAPNEMLAKKSAKFIAKNYPRAVVKCFKGKSHCENSLFNPPLMLAELDKALDADLSEKERTTHDLRRIG